MIQNLVKQIRSKKSFICVGLDPDLDKIPKRFLECEEQYLSLISSLLIKQMI